MKLKLTPNEMIVLLKIYRGEPDDEERKRPNYVQDVRYLWKHGLIDFDGELHVTPRGVERVMDVLE